MKRVQSFLAGLDIFLLCMFAGYMAEHGIMDFTKQELAAKVQTQTVAGRAVKDETEKKVALTFDDGPNPEYTEKLLNGLRERGVKATFFLLGAEVEKYPDIVKQMHEDGHLIGNHSYEHVNLSTLSDAEAVQQVDKTNQVISQITGENPEYIRPPYGCFKSNLDYETTMIEVLWDVDPLDWKTPDAAVVAQRILDQVKDEDIILLHDASETSVSAAFQVVDTLTKEGYIFVTVDEILFD